MSAENWIQILSAVAVIVPILLRALPLPHGRLIGTIVALLPDLIGAVKAASAKKQPEQIVRPQ